jgi:hypothetical protein
MVVSYGPKRHDRYRRTYANRAQSPIGMFSTKTKINSDEDVWLSTYLCAT